MLPRDRFLASLVKESSASIEVEEAVRLLSQYELEKIAEKPELDAAESLVGHLMQGAKTVPLAGLLGSAGVIHAALSDPQVDPQTGEPKSKLENMLAEGIGGAMVGHGISHISDIARGLHGPTGDYIRRSQLRVAKQTPNPTDREKSFKSIMKGRKAAQKVGREKAIIESRQEKKPSSASSDSGPSIDIKEEEPVSLSESLGNLPPPKPPKKASADANALKSLADYLKGGATVGAKYIDEVGPAGMALTLAAGNAIRKGIFPDKDASGQDKDFVDEAVKGAVTGGLAGLALGHGVRQFGPAIRGEKGWGEQAGSTIKNIGEGLKKIFPEGTPSKE